MLSDLLPFMTDNVEHWFRPVRDIHGRLPTSAAYTPGNAKITYSQGSAPARASNEGMPDATATIWLVNHPRAVAVGDMFKLPCGTIAKAARVERRSLDGATIIKVQLT